MPVGISLKLQKYMANVYENIDIFFQTSIYRRHESSVGERERDGGGGVSTQQVMATAHAIFIDLFIYFPIYWSVTLQQLEL